MVLQWMDNFGSYGFDEALMLDGLYADAQTTGSSLESDPDPNASGVVWHNGGNANTDGVSLRRVLSSAQTTVGIGLRLWMSRLPFGEGYPAPIVFRDGANNVLCCLTVTSTGKIQVRRGSTGGTVIGESSGPVLTADAWQHIEFKAVLDASTGEIEVRVEGVPEISESNVDNVGGNGPSCEQVSFDQHAPSSLASVETYIKDYVCWDGSGTENNDFLGSVFVARLVPTSDDTLNWSVSEGSTGWDLIDESPPNDDTDYIFANDTPPAASLFGMENLPTDITSVKGVMTMVRATKTDGGDGKLQVGIDVGGTVSNGADRAITAAFTYWFDTFDLSPDGDAWTPADIDSSLLRVDRTL